AWIAEDMVDLPHKQIPEIIHYGMIIDKGALGQVDVNGALESSKAQGGKRRISHWVMVRRTTPASASAPVHPLSCLCASPDFPPDLFRSCQWGSRLIPDARNTNQTRRR